MLAEALIKPIDIAIFLLFIIAVIAIGLIKSKGEETKSEHGAQDYFLAGRGLTWWLVGFSLIAANISTEQFVGMSGKSADWLGMAIASYEWLAAITLVVVAFVFLPKFLKSGIYTIPEFLEYRYNPFARTVMAVSTLVILVGVPTASVIYSGAKVICVFFQGQSLMGLDLSSITVGCWIIGVLAAVYVFAGGLKACAWADLIQGAALIIGGAVIAWFAVRTLGSADPASLSSAVGDVDVEKLRPMGAFERFKALNGGELPAGKLHMFRPADDPEIPWTALMLGLWIPNFFYWGLNQYITQRTLGSKSLREGQKGVVFSAFLKLIIPFVVVIPGILAFNLYKDDLRELGKSNNAEVIEVYDAAKADPAAAKVAFKFNGEFAEMNAEAADELLAFNAAVAGIDIPADVSKVEANTALLDKIDAINSDLPKDERIKVETELVGHDYDAAFPTLLKNLLPAGKGILGFVLAAIFGAVVSSLASMLNSASTIATMDIYAKIRHAQKKEPTQYELVTTGRVFTLLFVLVALVIAPQLGNPAFGGIFTFIQEFQGFISPGILTVFLFGLLVHKAPRSVGTVGLLLNPVLYGLFKFSPKIPVLKNIELMQTIAGWSFLNRMALCFVILLIVSTVMTIINPLKKPVELPVNEKMDMTPSKGTFAFGMLVIALTVVLYIVFF